MRKIYLILFVIAVAITNSNAQPYKIGHTTINFIDASRSNRNIATEVYYTADVSGDNVALTTLNSLKFPSLVFGFVMTWGSQRNASMNGYFQSIVGYCTRNINGVVFIGQFCLKHSNNNTFTSSVRF